MDQNVYPVMQRAVLPLLVLSLVSNLAILISPLFMMQVLDRVIPSGNTATLALLGLLALAALALQALVEATRDLSLGRLGRWAERQGTALALAPNASDQNVLIQRVVGFSNFLTGPGIVAALSAPWIPIFLCVLWLLHPAFVALLIVLAATSIVVDLTAKWVGRAAQQNVKHYADQEAKILRSASEADAEKSVAILARNIRRRFADLQRARHVSMDQGEWMRTIQTAVRGFTRNLGQIGALALGALLVTIDQLSAGGMIAASILTSKAFASIEALSMQLPAIRAAKADYAALAQVSAEQDELEQTKTRPSGILRVENLIFPRGGGAPPRLERIAFTLEPGNCLALIGGSGSGKSTLLQALSGITPSPIGSVFLGDHEVQSLNDNSLFEMVGYLPQRPIFKAGTIAENISSFDPGATSENIIEAAKTAGVHGLICALPDSYETDLGKQAYLLSAGQSQRVALARAIYSKPQYLFLDEPNALLDAEGERALGQTLLRLKRQGVTIVMAVHRAGVLVLADHVMQLAHGQISDFGPKDDVLSRLGMGGKQLELPILETSLPDLQDWLASQFTRAEDQPFRQKTRAIGAELLKISCAHCPADTLLFSKFSFKFIDSERCELTMTEPFPNDRQDRDAQNDVDGQETMGGNAESTLVRLCPEEVHFARVSDMGEAFEISSTEDATQYRVVITAFDHPAPVAHESRIQ